MKYKKLILMTVLFCSMAFAQQPNNYTATVDKTADYYEVSVSIDPEATAVDLNGVSLVSGTITFKDTTSKSRDGAEEITEGFNIQLDVREQPFAVSVGEDIWVEATSEFQQQLANNTTDQPWEIKGRHETRLWESGASSRQIHVKITSKIGIVLAEIKIAAKQN